MMLWFLLKDDPDPDGWQSGLITAAGEAQAVVRGVREPDPVALRRSLDRRGDEMTDAPSDRLRETYERRAEIRYAVPVELPDRARRSEVRATDWR